MSEPEMDHHRRESDGSFISVRENEESNGDPGEVEYGTNEALLLSASVIEQQQDVIRRSEPTTDLEKAFKAVLERKQAQIARLNREVSKLKVFISKRKQTYKRKRKDEGAPTRALSAYNIFVQDRFSQLAKDNEEALKSSDAGAQLKRVPPASLVASTGNQWKELSAEDKLLYENKAAEDRKRYEHQMAAYQPPEKQKNKKRNKTGYNMFFSAHVLRLKQTDAGVPSERGSVARLVGNAWKDLSSEDKQYYEREAEKQNAMYTGENDEDDCGKGLSLRNLNQRPPHGNMPDSHEERMGHHDPGMSHHPPGTLMHQMMHGPQLHHGPQSHVNSQLGLPAQGYHHTSAQHHHGHQAVGYHGLPHQQHPPYHAHVHTPRNHPPQYSQHHSSYHQGSMGL